MPDLVAKGLNGTVVVEGYTITIVRTGIFSFLTQGFKNDKRILISSLTSVQFREPGFANGYIRFEYMGASEAGRGNFSSDENAVMFQKGLQTEQFHQIRAIVESKMNRRSKTGEETSIADEISKLSELRRRGLISDAEFAQGKQRLLR